VTLTTVGYGDLVPGTTLGKLFTSFYVFLGLGLVGALVSGAANYVVEMQEKMLIHTIKRKENKDHTLSEEMDAEHSIWKVVFSGLTLMALVVVGTVVLMKVEDMDPVDAVYCVCVTVTTLGYGDNSFKTTTGRIFAIVWILTGTVFVAQFFLYVAEWRTFSRQLELAHWVLHRKTTQRDLEAADLDGDGVVSAPEFVIFKLKELGKIDEEDVTGILEEFHQLDYDGSGTISLDDLKASQGGDCD
jgi:potassium channel subfamily K